MRDRVCSARAVVAAVGALLAMTAQAGDAQAKARRFIAVTGQAH
ncbi:hypothetical protein [Mesorhizobium sp. AR10]|nr:hypothetical protein [Mesorhizobium sp. AR10]